MNSFKQMNTIFKTTNLKLALCLVMLCGAVLLSGQEANSVRNKVNVSVQFYKPNRPDSPVARRVRELLKKDKSLSVSAWGGIKLPEGSGKASIVMAIAGKTAPDIMEEHFHVIRNDIRQGFLYPLNEWIGNDDNGDGRITGDEVKWAPWKQIPPLWRRVAMVNGKIYGIPQPSYSYVGVIFRVDLVRAAGLDPDNPPKTWDELAYWCQRLTDPGKQIPGATYQRGQKGIVLLPNGFTWLPWVQSDGGSPVVQVRKDPATGKEYVFPMEATKFITPNGKNLASAKPRWKADFTSKAAIAATGFYHRLRWMKWIRDPETGEPVTLCREDLLNGYVMKSGKKIVFTENDIITGVARTVINNQREKGPWGMLARGEVAMTTWFVTDLGKFAEKANINPELLSWFPFPAGPDSGGVRVVQKQQHYSSMCEAVGGRTKGEREKVWEVLTGITGKEISDAYLQERILGGLAKFVPPADLKRLGFEDYLRDVPPMIRRNFNEIESGKVRTFTEPFMGFWWTMGTAIDREVLSLLLAETGENFDYKSALKNIEHKANSGLMFGRTQAELDKYRPAARIALAVITLIIIVFSYFIIRSFMKKKGDTSKQVYSIFLPWMLLLPALLLVALWRYYPLLRGMVMAFQDYHVAGGSKWVGLDNFITLALDGSWWASLGRTVYFVFLNMLLAFTSPIFLAVLLSEVPRGKVFYRTLFFLPQITSGIVITLLWKLMYDPTPMGFLNKVISLLNMLPLVHIDSQTWLLDPKLAMLCCVIPTVWASMGMASLIYLAALHSIPGDLYEAADIDGAGFMHKLRYITLPTLLPLIIINFFGTFIATFQNMGGIFLLTYGGPGVTTTVAGLRIWQEAYANLRFSMATSMAWILGAILIAFSYLQIRILRKVEFKKADWN